MAAGNDVESRYSCSNEEVQHKANQSGVRYLGEGAAAKDSDRDPLQDTYGCDAAKAIEDQRVGEIQRTRNQACERDGLKILGAAGRLNLHEESIVARTVLLRNPGVGFNLDSPLRVQKGCNDHHRGSRTDETEEFAVYAASGLPVLNMGQIHAGTVDVFEGAPGVFQGGSDEGKTLIGLLGDVAIVCANGTRSGDVDMVADAYGT
jgi:hypothetical protein